MRVFRQFLCEVRRMLLLRRWVNKGKKRGGARPRARASPAPLAFLVRRQAGDLVRLEHRVPGGAVGRDRDPERLAVLDDLALGDDAGVRDAGYVAFGGLGEPDRAVGRGRDVLRAGVWSAGTRSLSPSSGSSRPTPWGSKRALNQTSPSAATVIPRGTRVSVCVSVALPVAGSSLPIAWSEVAANQTIPASSTATSLGSGTGNWVKLSDSRVVAPEAVVVEVRVPDVVAVGGDAAAVGTRVVRGHERQYRVRRRDAPQAGVVGGEVHDVIRPLHDVVEQAEALGGPYALLYAELGDLTRRRDPTDVAVEGAAPVWVGAGGEDFVALGEPEVAVGVHGDVRAAGCCPWGP